jgi:hypothetical protein
MGASCLKARAPGFRVGVGLIRAGSRDGAGFRGSGAALTGPAATVTSGAVATDCSKSTKRATGLSEIATRKAVGSRLRFRRSGARRRDE